jgi:transketolase
MNDNKHLSTDELKHIASDIRCNVVHSIAAAGSGHTGGSLGLADVFAVLYFHVMNHRPQEPLWKDRDRLILSIGHVAPVLYATLAEAGYFGKEELLTLRKLGSRLQGHPGRDHGLPGLELSAGSLGQGLSVAVGMALAARIDKNNYRIYTVHGDGELEEGSIWEAAMSASHYKLDNLIALVDRNGLQIDGRTEDVMHLEPLDDKWRSFGWEVLECNGNDIDELISVYDKALQTKGKPVVIIAHTTMGKGVPSIENDHRWHGKAPSAKEEEEFCRWISEHE